MPAKVWCDEVEPAEGVEGTADGTAGDTVEPGEVPCDLRGVDGEVRSDGSVQALLCEDVVAGVFFGDGLSGDLSEGMRLVESRLDSRDQQLH